MDFIIIWPSSVRETELNVSCEVMSTIIYEMEGDSVETSSCLEGNNNNSNNNKNNITSRYIHFVEAVPINIVYIRNQSSLLADYDIYISQCHEADNHDEVYVYPSTIHISPQDRGLSDSCSSSSNAKNSTALVLFNTTEQIDSHSEDAVSDFELNVQVIFSKHTLQLPQFLNTTWSTSAAQDSLNHPVQSTAKRHNQRPTVVTEKEDRIVHIQNQRMQLAVVLFLLLYYCRDIYRAVVKSSLYLHSRWMTMMMKLIMLVDRRK